VIQVNATLEECRRLDIDEHGTLTRVVASPTARRDQNNLDLRRGEVLEEVNGSPITPEQPLSAILDKIESLADGIRAGNRAEDLQIVLTFRKRGWPPDPTEEQRQRRNGLFIPTEMITELTDQQLLLHLQPVGLLHKPIKDLTSLPSGSFLYFNHPNWKLQGLGSLLELPLRSVRELDLSGCALSDVGAAVGRFEHLVDLRLSDNQLPSIDLHYLPRLKHLDLSYNRLVVRAAQ
jgi:Leucine-rich repeat (LRR) protein